MTLTLKLQIYTYQLNTVKPLTQSNIKTTYIHISTITSIKAVVKLQSDRTTKLKIDVKRQKTNKKTLLAYKNVNEPIWIRIIPQK